MACAYGMLEFLAVVLWIQGVSHNTIAVSKAIASNLNVEFLEKTENSGESHFVTCNGISGTCVDPSTFHLSKNSTSDGNNRRYLFEDVTRDSQCSTLRKLNAIVGKIGDGYQRFKKYGSPFSERERFVGMSPSALAEAVKTGIVTPAEALVFFTVSDSVLANAEKALGTKYLYINYQHLVCREAVQMRGETSADDEPSHPLHADNCSVQKNGTCTFDNPHFIPRNFSSFVYLGDQVEGGEFYFANKQTLDEEMKVAPKCGRMVLFHSDELHGVKAITSGKRCALGVWLTTVKAHEDPSRMASLKAIMEFMLSGEQSEPPKPLGP